MEWGERRADLRADLFREANASFKAGKYREALELGKRALKLKHRYKPQSAAKLKEWYKKLQANVALACHEHSRRASVDHIAPQKSSTVLLDGEHRTDREMPVAGSAGTTRACNRRSRSGEDSNANRLDDSQLRRTVSTHDHLPTRKKRAGSHNE